MCVFYRRLHWSWFKWCNPCHALRYHERFSWCNLRSSTRLAVINGNTLYHWRRHICCTHTGADLAWSLRHLGISTFHFLLLYLHYYYCRCHYCYFCAYQYEACGQKCWNWSKCKWLQQRFVWRSWWLHSFLRHLKTFLFERSFPDVIVTL